MSNFFDIKRFGNYLLCEADRARSNFLWSAIVCALSPALVFVVAQTVSVLFSGHFSEDLGMVGSVFAMIGVGFVTLITFPSKMYGNITDKRWGSDFLMLPASTFEKWLSIVLITCVMAPVVIFGAFILCDALMSLCFGSYYGGALISNLARWQKEFLDTSLGGLNVNLSAYSFIDWCSSVLVFTLGAIVFKTGKVGKTILSLMAVGFVFGTVVTLVIFSNISFANPELIESQVNALFSHSSLIFNILCCLWYVLILGALGGGIYYRLRTLSH